MTDQFPYKKVLVIGATSGIGHALVKKLVEGGAQTIAVGRRKEALEGLVHELGHEKVSAVPFDITNLDGIPNFCKGIVNSNPDLDYIIFNSGIQRKADFSEPDSIDISAISEEFTTNYLSHLAMTKGFLPAVKGKDHEVGLCYVTSGLSLVPMPRAPNYCASKAAMHQFLLSLRYQLKDTNVKVYELMPPAVQTELHDEKHQPDLKDGIGSKIGMPLKDFTEAAYAGLAAKKACVPVGSAVKQHEMIDGPREQEFNNFLEMMETHLPAMKK